MVALPSAFDPLHDVKILPPPGFRSQAKKLAKLAEDAVANDFPVHRPTAAEMQAAENELAAERSAIASKRGHRCRVRKGRTPA